MKNVSRNKFLLCFRPVVDMDFAVDHPKKNSLTYNRVENKEDKKGSMTKSSLSGNSCSKNSESLIIVQRPKRTFSQVIKAVVFETILAKRVRDRNRLTQNSYRSKRSVSINSQRSLASSDDKSVNQVSVDNEIEEIKSDPELSTSSSLSSTSSCSSSILEPKTLTKSLLDIKNSTKQSQNKQQVGTLKGDKNGSSFNTGIYLLLISLTLTILWGKICAILFTSIWLYFVPRRHAGSDICEPEHVTKLAKVMSRGYKKRVIMEGLLERKPPQRGIKYVT